MIDKENETYKIDWKDWLFFLAIALVCFCTMQQSDIIHTGSSSFALLRGHIKDFYEYNAQYLAGNNYMISTYVLFAIWNIPLEILGIVGVPSMHVPYGVVMWYKLLPTIVFVGSSFVMFRIGEILGLSKRKAKILAFVFLSTPVAFFSQFIFGQYDVFTVFFMLLAVWIYFKEGKRNILYFSFLFGIAGTFKYHAFLFFVPLLLIKEKNILKIVKNVCVALLPIVIVNLPYISSEKFQNGVGGFGALDYIFASSIDFFSNDIYIVPILWVLICVYAYLKNETDDKFNSRRWPIFLCNAVITVVFGLAFWHPQWLMIAAPFLALSFYISDRKDILCILDIVFSAVFFVYVVNTWPDHVDQALFSFGMFGEVMIPKLSSAVKMRELYVITDRNILLTCMTGILLARTLILHPNNQKTDVVYSEKVELNWIRGRFIISILFFVVPMFVCMYSAFVDKFNELVEFDNSELEYCVGYEVNGNEYVAMTNDPQISYKIVPEKVAVVVVDFSKPIEEELILQIYYAKEGKSFSEDGSVAKYVAAGSQQAYLELPGDTYDAIRVDLNGDFVLERISRTADGDIKDAKTYIITFFVIYFVCIMIFAITCIVKKR